MALKPRKVPERTCVGCRTVRPKRELIRVVRRPDGEVTIDTGGKVPGRGAYLCPDEACFEQAVKRKALERALQIPIDAEVLESLRLRIAKG